MSIAVIGLGKFGFYLGRELMGLGREVLGLDADHDKVQRARDVLTQTYRLDATDKQALAQVNAGEMTHVVVSVGHSMEASILITLYLKELGAPNVAVKAVSDDHENILRKIGADKVLIPERFAAKRLAHTLLRPNILEYLPMAGDTAIQKIVVDKWAGKTLRELDLTNQFEIQALARKSPGDAEFGNIPRADALLAEGDTLVLVGSEENLDKLTP